MGWTTIKTNKSAEEIALDMLDSKYELLYSYKKGDVLYCAIKNRETNYISAEIFLTSKNIDGTISVKNMSEVEGPYYYDANKKLLNMLSPTTNENALEWREICLKRNIKLKEGDIIEFEKPIEFVNDVVCSKFVYYKQFAFRLFGTNEYAIIKDWKDRKYKIIKQ